MTLLPCNSHQTNTITLIYSDDDGLGSDPAFRAPPGADATSSNSSGSLSLSEVWQSRDPAVRHGLRTIVLAQFFQQLSGINAVMYFSVGILTKVNPASAKTVALLVTAVNVSSALRRDLVRC